MIKLWASQGPPTLHDIAGPYKEDSGSGQKPALQGMESLRRKGHSKPF